MERDAVPARGLVTRTRAASGPARPALRLGREELANRQRRRLKAVSTCRVYAARSRAEASKPRRVPRRSAERRARPQADARGNADHPWRAPHWPRIRMLSSEVPVRITTLRLSALRLPLFFLEATAFVQWLF